MRILHWPVLIVLLYSLGLPYKVEAQSIEELFQQGNEAQLGQSFSEAEKIWRQILQQEPHNAAAYNKLGEALSGQDRLDEAIAAYRQAIQLDPNFIYAHNNLGNALGLQNQWDEAIVAYRRVIQLNPNYAYAYNGLGNALSAQDKLDEAIAVYRQATQLDPNFLEAYNNLGNALGQKNLWSEAIVAYRRAIQLNPNYAYAYNGLGNALSAQDKLDEAIENYQHALDIDPMFYIAQNNLREAQRLLTLQGNPQSVQVDDRPYLPRTDDPLLPVLRSTARIITQQIGGGISIGSGWVVKREGSTVWIVTNRHVVSDKQTNRPSNKVEIEFFSNLPNEKRPRYLASIKNITSIDEEPDLAVLEVTQVPVDIKPLEVHLGSIIRNTPIRVIGHPYTLDVPWNSSSGEISSYNPNNPIIPVNAYVAEGNSGGPVINQQMQVIAMMVGIRSSQDIATDPTQQTPEIRDISPATGEVGLAYRLDIVMKKLQIWRILD